MHIAWGNSGPDAKVFDPAIGSRTQRSRRNMLKKQAENNGPVKFWAYLPVMVKSCLKRIRIYLNNII